MLESPEMRKNWFDDQFQTDQNIDKLLAWKPFNRLKHFLWSIFFELPQISYFNQTSIFWWYLVADQNPW